MCYRLHLFVKHCDNKNLETVSMLIEFNQFTQFTNTEVLFYVRLSSTKRRKFISTKYIAKKVLKYCGSKKLLNLQVLVISLSPKSSLTEWKLSKEKEKKKFNQFNENYTFKTLTWRVEQNDAFKHWFKLGQTRVYEWKGRTT